MADNEKKIHNVVIIGSGPAGWTAGIYLGRANLSPVLYCGAQVGGQLTTTTEIENFPGFPEGRDGPELMMDMEAQAKKYGTQIVYDTIKSVDLSKRPFTLRTEDSEFQAHSIIIATGASPKMLNLPGEKTFWNRGVHTCAVCDGSFYRGKTVAVVGGGDSAMEEAMYLAKLCAKVYVVHRRAELRASRIMADRALATPNMEFLWNSTIADVIGDTSGKFPKTTGLILKSTVDESTREVAVDAMFLAIGHTPNSAFLGGQVEVDDAGYIVVNEAQQTNVEGVYAAGDIHDHVYRQAITAAGFGCKAALEVERFLARQGVTS
ncbi:thioredoxin-disulfide reductase [bacterium]|nr:thioredoxin-disulfide reductase [bacterium]